MTKAEWVDRFVTWVSKLGVSLRPDQVLETAEETYLVYGLTMGPEEAAQIEYGELSSDGSS